MKLAVQCDFDGTITEEDVSFLLADTFVGDKWREMLQEYTSGRIPVGAFNKKVFSLVKADEQTQLDVIFRSDRVKIRPGLKDLIDYCRSKDYKFIIVSNGLTFYIEALLENLDLKDVEVGRKLADALDRRLMESNTEYAAKRDSQRLDPIRLELIPSGTWQDWDRQRLAKTGGSLEQYKHPCLINDLHFRETMPVEQEVSC